MDFTQCVLVLECFPWSKRADFEDIYSHYQALEPVIMSIGETPEERGLSVYYTLERLSHTPRSERSEYVNRILAEYGSYVEEEDFDLVELDDEEESDDLLLYRQICAGEAPEEYSDESIEEEERCSNPPCEEYLRYVAEFREQNDSDVSQECTRGESPSKISHKIASPRQSDSGPAVVVSHPPPSSKPSKVRKRSECRMRAKYKVAHSITDQPAPAQSPRPPDEPQKLHHRPVHAQRRRRRRKGRSADDLDIISPNDGKILFKLHVPKTAHVKRTQSTPLHPLAPDGYVGLVSSQLVARFHRELRR